MQKNDEMWQINNLEYKKANHSDFIGNWRGVKVSRNNSLDQLQLNDEFDPLWLLNNFGFFQTTLRKWLFGCHIHRKHWCVTVVWKQLFCFRIASFFYVYLTTVYFRNCIFQFVLKFLINFSGLIDVCIRVCVCV